jgi:FKBP-type peptidyl-prolyl cis-trans isomerase
MSMCLGEKAELTITAEHGYGAVGAPPLIPPNATLFFTIELLKIRNRPPTKWLTTD